MSVTIDGYTISRATGHSPITIVDPEGQPVDLTHVWYGEGGVIITDGEGNQVATLDGPTFQSVLNGPNAADISSVPRISAAGNTTVIAVTLKERNADGVPRQHDGP